MKKILAIAIASAFAAPAFAATSNVDIYGVVGMSVDYVDGGSGTAGDSFTSKDSESRARVSSNTSYIGFKGSEDLGGGLSAVWQIEQSVSIDQGTGTAANGQWAAGRNSFAGLSSKSLGTLTFGNQDTPYKTSTGKLDVFGGGQYLADYRSLFGEGTNGSVRATNSALYTSPSFGGLTLRALGAAQQENGSTGDPKLYSLSGVYTNGPLFATLAYETNTFNTTGTANIVTAGGYVVTGTAGNNYEAEQKKWRAGVGFSFGDTTLGLAYENSDYEISNMTLGTSASADRDVWYVSAAHKIGNATLKAAYTKADDFQGAADTGATQYSFGASYALSKRTEMFGLYTQVKNDSAANYSLGGGGTGVHAVTAAAAGEDPRGFSIGMIHKF
ncbi:MAG: porin [Thiobacillus sp.]|nr:porin [Thiobacillus sp.]